MTKQEAREWMKKKRSELNNAERDRQNRAVAELLLSSDVWQTVEWFFPFVSYGTEVDTRAIIQQVLKQNIARVAVPWVRGRDMDFFEIGSLEDLEEGFRGIEEPKTSCRKIIAQEGLMLLPGLAFDRQRNRVGYGGGFYDRYLGQYGNVRLRTWAVAFDFQVVDCIEAEKHDIRPEQIITPDGILR